jgi:hypothetical protein
VVVERGVLPARLRVPQQIEPAHGTSVSVGRDERGRGLLARAFADRVVALG